MRLDTHAAALARPLSLAIFPSLALLAASALATSALAGQDDPAAPKDPVAAARAELLRTMQPPAAQDGTGPELAEVKAAIQRILAGPKPDTSRVRIFGSQGAAALRSIIEDVGLQTVALDFELNPLPILMEEFPADAVDYLVELERADAPLFDIYVRSGFGPGRLIRRGRTEGVARAALLDLFDRTLRRMTLSTSERVSLALDALGAGISTPASKALITGNLEFAVAQYNDAAEDDLARFIRETRQADFAGMPSGLAYHLLNHDPDEPLLRGLVEHENTYVRKAVIRTLGSMRQERTLRPAAAAEILLALIADPIQDVQVEAYTELERVLDDNQGLLDLDQLERVAQALMDGATVDTNFAGELANSVEFHLVDLDQEQHGRIVEVIQRFFDAEQPKLHQMFRARLLQVSYNPEAILAAMEVLLEQEGVDPRRLTALGGNLTRSGIKTPEQAAHVVRLLRMVGGRLDLTQILRDGYLNVVGPEFRSEALAWMGTADEGFIEMALDSIVDWEGAEDAFRTAAYDGARPWRERAIALTGLILSEGTAPEDSQKMLGVLREALADDARRETFARVFRLGIHENPSGSSPHWASVVAALHEDASIPAELLSGIYPLRKAESDREAADVARIIDAVDRRRQQGQKIEQKAAYASLETALDPTRGVAVLEGHGDLVVAWARGQNVDNLCVSYAITKEPGLLDGVLAALLENLAGAKSDWSWKPLVDQVLRIPSDGAVPQLLATTQLIGRPDLVKYVDERVSELLRIREVEQRWGGLSGGSTTTDGAKASVVRMLDDEREVVRVEAIRSLATLGAVETLPRLIEILASGSEKEVAAARIALDQLHRRAALTLDEAEGK